MSGNRKNVRFLKSSKRTFIMPIPCDVRDVMLRTNDRLYCFLCKVARLPKHGHTRDVIIYDNKDSILG